MCLIFVDTGAEGRTRTDTELPPQDFESSASTISPLRHRGKYNGRLIICFL